jgi:hypothetical protein
MSSYGALSFVSCRCRLIFSKATLYEYLLQGGWRMLRRRETSGYTHIACLQTVTILSRWRSALRIVCTLNSNTTSQSVLYFVIQPARVLTVCQVSSEGRDCRQDIFSACSYQNQAYGAFYNTTRNNWLPTKSVQ